MRQLDIEAQVKKVKQAIADFIENTDIEMEVPYVHSWWFNHNNKEYIGLDTPTFNRRCNVLVKRGFLVVDKDYFFNLIF